MSQFSSRFWDFAIRRVLFRGFFRRHEAKMRLIEEKLSQSSGVETLAPLAIPMGAQEFRTNSASSIARFRSYDVPPLLQIAPIIASGKTFGLEYLALTPPAERAKILAKLREMLPYARLTIEGEFERPMLRAAKNSTRTCRFWAISIALEAPGFGITDAQIEQHQDDFVVAARDFRIVADEILRLLMTTHDLSLDTLPHIGSMAVAPGGIAHGHSILGYELANWRLEFQMGALFLTHLETAQEVRVSMFHREIGGILQPHGFARFLKTTPRWNSLGALLKDDFFDARRVIEKLNEQNRWELIPRNPDIRLLGTNGLAAPLSP